MNAGLNKYHFEMANIRNQNSWCHSKDKPAATEKAKDLVRMAIAKAQFLKPLKPGQLSVNHAALIIGGGLAGITAAVVGVIGSLSLWFAIHVLFGRVADMRLGPLSLPWPDLTSISLPSLLIMAVAGVLLLKRHWPLVWVLALSAALGALTLLLRGA